MPSRPNQLDGTCVAKVWSQRITLNIIFNQTEQAGEVWRVLRLLVWALWVTPWQDI